MKRRWHIISCSLAALFVWCCNGDAWAQSWSLDLSGAENQMFYGYYGQTGNRGFFGAYDLDRSSTGGNFAPLNGWVGNRFADLAELVSGTNAANSAFSLKVDPKYGNEWVILKGRYAIASYDISTTQGSFVAISPGNLTMWSVQVNNPIARIYFGKYGFQRGFSLQFCPDRTAEYLVLERETVVPDILGCLVHAGLLPRRAMLWFNPQWWPRHKRQPYPKDPPYGIEGYEEPEDKFFYSPLTGRSRFKDADEDGKHGFFQSDPDEDPPRKGWPTDKDAYAWGQCGPGRLQLAVGLYPWEAVNLANPWYGHDQSGARIMNYLATMVYSSSDLEIGIGTTRSTLHQGPELQQTTTLRLSTPTFERYITEGWWYLKYNNGRFFVNSELDWYNRVDRYQRSADGTFGGIRDNVDGSGSLFRSRYVESWRYMSEVGAAAGPLVVRLFYSFMPGPDRRHGVRIDRQPFIQDDLQKALGVFDPYSTLLSYRFGAGVNAPAHINDAAVYAVKLDYALASNLMLQGSFLTARRVSHGYGWGSVRPNTVAAQFGRVFYDTADNFAAPAPSIPDNDLGWEIMGGVVWKLLEGWAVSARISYWKPGKWFNYACVDRAVANWDIPTAANLWGINPNRTIDPVVGLELFVGTSY